MRLLLTGACGFAGSSLIRGLLEQIPGIEIWGVDNFIRPGSELNRTLLKQLGVKLIHGDIRSAADVETWPSVDWVIDAAANPSVLAGTDGRVSSRQLIEHNLLGTVNILEFCKRTRAGFILASTSRVYSIEPLAALKVENRRNAFHPVLSGTQVPGLTENGVSERFPTTPPVSLYGASKAASEQLALEYGEIFGFPVWINRCGVLAGAGQFGRPDQGIFTFWINSYLRRKPMKYIGFGGTGHQVRDCLHPRDLAPVFARQMSASGFDGRQRVQNLSGGTGNSMSLAQLSEWCAGRFGFHEIIPDPTPRAFDVPWLVLDSKLAADRWGWKPTTGMDEILSEIASHAQENPNWLELSNP